jgi:DNA-binding transcriptional MerR regulator
MRMQDLSRAAGLPVPTVKYYLREGLLAPGERVGPNQAQYGAGHLRRLKQVRALVEVGGLSVAEVRSVLGAGESRPRRAPSTHVSDEDRQWAMARIAAIAQANHWAITDDAPAVTALTRVLCTVREFCPDAVLDRIDEYAGLADAIADIDLAARHDQVSMVLGDALLAALRQLARDSRHPASPSLQSR